MNVDELRPPVQMSYLTRWCIRVGQQPDEASGQENMKIFIKKPGMAQMGVRNYSQPRFWSFPGAKFLLQTLGKMNLTLWNPIRFFCFKLGSQRSFFPAVVECIMWLWLCSASSGKFDPDGAAWIFGPNGFKSVASRNPDPFSGGNTSSCSERFGCCCTGCRTPEPESLRDHLRPLTLKLLVGFYCERSDKMLADPE